MCEQNYSWVMQNTLLDVSHYMSQLRADVAAKAPKIGLSPQLYDFFLDVYGYDTGAYDIKYETVRKKSALHIGAVTVDTYLSHMHRNGYGATSASEITFGTLDLINSSPQIFRRITAHRRLEELYTDIFRPDNMLIETELPRRILKMPRSVDVPIDPRTLNRTMRYGVRFINVSAELAEQIKTDQKKDV